MRVVHMRSPSNAINQSIRENFTLQRKIQEPVFYRRLGYDQQDTRSEHSKCLRAAVVELSCPLVEDPGYYK